MRYLGIDGSKGGWCVAHLEHGKFTIYHESKLCHILNRFEDIQSILIDIPVGIGSESVCRNLESVARNELKPYWSSSIFTPPIREALAEDTYAEACSVNAKIIGKKISIQSWNISRKIVEVDAYLVSNPGKKDILHESHPEICFKYLNRGNLLFHRKNKKDSIGIRERLEILSWYYPEIYDVFNREKKRMNPKVARIDDLVDAICLGIVAQFGFEFGYEKLIGSEIKDEKNIEMSLYYFNPIKHDFS